VKAVVIMPKRRSTIPIAHADDVPTIAFTDEQWQATEHAYRQQLNAEVRQQIATVTTLYLKECIFERTAAPKAMVRKRIEHIRRGAGDLEKVMLDSKPFSASTDELSREHQEQQQSVHSYTDHLIRRHFNDPRLAAGWRGDHFRGVLTSLVVACDCALNDLSAAEGYRGGEAWNCWIQGLTQIAQEHSLPAGVSTELDRNGRPLPFVRLVQELERYLPANARSRRRSPAALAMAISRARNT
jgi:hypothetical protein